jgi:putative SOS response-associated peptidase YedK
MCGRFAITLPPEAMRGFFRYLEQPNFPPRYNIAPTQPVPIVYARRELDRSIARHYHLVRWGFVPVFVENPNRFPLLINARSETLRSKPSFKNAFKRRRCLFMADAFYEWRREGEPRGGNSRPYLVHRYDGNPMGLAGLWETWIGPNGEEQDTACIVTTAANGATAAIHDRLPVLIEPEDFDIWLDPDEARADAAFALLKSPADTILDFYEIGSGINKVANDSADLQLPVSPKTDMRRHATSRPDMVPVQGKLL